MDPETQLPQPDATGQNPYGPPQPGRLPDSSLGTFSSALISVLVASLLGVGFTALSVGGFRAYGYVLFVFSPLICGFAAAALEARYSAGRPASSWAMGALVMALLVVSFICIMLLMSGMEGLICLIMASPLTLLLAVLGASLGRGVGRRGPQQTLPALSVLVLVYPAAQYMESSIAEPPAPHIVSTRVLVQAPPARVWQVLTRPVQYPAEVGWLFRAGVAYPTRTAIARTADGRRVLRCAYSQGGAELPITRWQPGRELTFRIPNTPAPMQELSPYPRIHAPHLHGYFSVDSGTVRLRPQPGGATLLEATTVYRHSIAPRGYWQLWSDYLLDDMHQRVLLALKTEAETGHE